MKAIILAGGLGKRIDRYAKDIPKCMLDFFGKPLLQWQIDNYKALGINNVIVVRKHLADKINIPGVKYYDETDFDTHMVVGLFHARNEFDDDIIMSYGDLAFEKKVLENVLKFKGDVGVVVDINWQIYWFARFYRIDKDLETLIIKDDKIVSLGVETNKPEEMQARYVGIVKFSKNIIKDVEKIYDEAKSNYWDKPWYNSKSFKKAYITDFLQALIDSGIKVQPIKISGGWLEFDTNEDYENVFKWMQEGKLSRFYKLGG